MTNHERARRGFTDNPYCRCCPDNIEDLNHVFRTCAKARSFWALDGHRGKSEKTSAGRVPRLAGMESESV